MIFRFVFWHHSHTRVLFQHFSQLGFMEAQVLMMVDRNCGIWMKPTGEFVPFLRNFLPTHSLIQGVLDTPFKMTFLYAIMIFVVIYSIILLVITTSASRSKLSILKEHSPFIYLMVLCNSYLGVS